MDPLVSLGNSLVLAYGISQENKVVCIHITDAKHGNFPFFHHMTFGLAASYRRATVASKFEVDAIHN